MNDYVGSNAGGDSIELFSGLAQLWAGRWWVLASTIIVAAGFSIGAFVMTPVYRAAIILVPAAQERAGLNGMLSSALGSFDGLASLAGIQVGAAAQATDEALAVLRSREFTESFINERNLLPVLYADRWDAAAAKWGVPPEKQPSLGVAVKQFWHDILSVTQDKKTGLLTLQIEWTDRIAAADWANDLVRRLNAQMRGRAIANADASLRFLRKELDAAAAVETRMAISRLMESQVNQRMISSITDEFSFRVVDRAIPADRGDVARPNKMLLISFGLLVGFVLGATVVILRNLLRHRVRSRR